MEIVKYISELLYKHECVVVPGFGGFVTDYASAKIHPVSHTFYPPSKSILFNSKLDRNDGLLLHHISIREKISFEEAGEKVKIFVHDCHERLNHSKKVVFDQIGYFQKDKEGTLLFDPDPSVNYLEESYGLPTFISPPIVREPMHKRFERKFMDRKPVPEKGNNRRKVIASLAVIVPAVLVVAWIIFNYDLRNDKTQESSLVPIENQTVDKTIPEKPIDISAKTTPLKDFKFDANTGKAGQSIPESGNDADINTKTPAKQYYIIGGAFQNPDNAEKLLESLRNKGYPAQSAGENADGLQMVAYFISENKSEVLANLAIIRRDDNPSAWLLKK